MGREQRFGIDFRKYYCLCGDLEGILIKTAGLYDDETLTVWKVACLEAASQIMKRVVAQRRRATSVYAKLLMSKRRRSSELRVGVGVRLTKIANKLEWKTVRDESNILKYTYFMARR
jgi:hypothetical protein